MYLKEELRRKFAFIRRRGLRGLLEAAGVLERKDDFIAGLSYITKAKKQTSPNVKNMTRKNATDIVTINWHLSDVPYDSWQHFQLFKLITELENLNTHNRICLFDSRMYRNNIDALRNLLRSSYPCLDCRCEIISDSKHAPHADIDIATNWQTAYEITSLNSTSRKYYFISQFEPYHFPAGSFKSFCEKTFDLNLQGICIGPFIRNKILAEHRMEFFELSLPKYQENMGAQRKQDEAKRIAFYANSVDQTYNYILGMLALEIVCKKHPDLEVVYLGEIMGHRFSPASKSYDLGLLKPQEYADALEQCDLFVYLSIDNPTELLSVSMAAKTVPVVIDGPNNRWFLNESNSFMAKPDVADIASVICDALDNPCKIKHRQLDAGINTASDCDSAWRREAAKLYDSLFSINQQ